MNKKIFIISFILVFFVLLFIVVFKTNRKCESGLKDVNMIIKENTLTTSGASVVIKDLSGDNNIYGEYYRIEKEQNKKWIELETKSENNNWNSKGYKVDSNGSLEFYINWNSLYGTLEQGTYRIVKNVIHNQETNPYSIYAEFKIK